MSARELNLKAEREAFERACPGLNPLRYIDDSAYCSEVVEYHWKGWLAARRADLEIPRPDTGSHLYSEVAREAANFIGGYFEHEPMPPAIVALVAKLRAATKPATEES